MSLSDLGVSGPLKADHPIVLNHVKCWRCSVRLVVGTRMVIAGWESSEDDRPICATCHLRDRVISTPRGDRVVDRIKDGDGSPYPVLTTDGEQWRADEVGVSDNATRETTPVKWKQLSNRQSWDLFHSAPGLWIEATRNVIEEVRFETRRGCTKICVNETGDGLAVWCRA